MFIIQFKIQTSFSVFMVVIRSQSSKNNQIEPSSMDYYSDNENDVSISECSLRGATTAMNMHTCWISREITKGSHMIRYSWITKIES